MEEKIRNAKIAIIDRITKAINDTNVKIAPSDLETLSRIILVFSIPVGDEKYSTLISKFIQDNISEV